MAGNLHRSQHKSRRNAGNTALCLHGHQPRFGRRSLAGQPHFSTPLFQNTTRKKKQNQNNQQTVTTNQCTNTEKISPACDVFEKPREEVSLVGNCKILLQSALTAGRILASKRTFNPSVSLRILTPTCHLSHSEGDTLSSPARLDWIFLR